MTATKTRKPRSPFQADDAFGAILVNRKGARVLTAADKGYIDTRYVEYINAERTIAVVGYSRDYAVVAKTDLAPTDVLDVDNYYLGEGYEEIRARGVWAPVASGIGSKTHARTVAEYVLAGVQDVEHPFAVALDGKHAPALTIASQQWANETWRQDDARHRALADLATETGIYPSILVLAVKEDRLTWSTPPVAPKQVLVTVYETETANLSERMVDEVVLATREVVGLGRIVHEGGVSEFLVLKRQRDQRNAVRAILTARHEVTEALASVQQRTEALLASLAKGEHLGRGFRDGIRLAEEAERAQSAASNYTAAILRSDLPEAFLGALMRDEYSDQDAHYRYVEQDIRAATKALAALTGMEIETDDRY